MWADICLPGVLDPEMVPFALESTLIMADLISYVVVFLKNCSKSFLAKQF